MLEHLSKCQLRELVDNACQMCELVDRTLVINTLLTSLLITIDLYFFDLGVIVILDQLLFLKGTSEAGYFSGLSFRIVFL